MFLPLILSLHVFALDSPSLKQLLSTHLCHKIFNVLISFFFQRVFIPELATDDKILNCSGPLYELTFAHKLHASRTFTQFHLL